MIKQYYMIGYIFINIKNQHRKITQKKDKGLKMESYEYLKPQTPKIWHHNCLASNCAFHIIML